MVEIKEQNIASLNDPFHTSVTILQNYITQYNVIKIQWTISNSMKRDLFCLGLKLTMLLIDGFPSARN